MEIKNWQQRKEDALNRAKLHSNFSSDKIKMFRNILGLSQNEFSQLLMVHQSQLSKWEKGDKIRDIVALENLNKLVQEWKQKKIKQLISEIEFIENF